MIDPVIFSFKLFNLEIVLRWYGVLVMLGAVVGTLIAEREIRRRGENGESIWDGLVWVLPAGIIGARLWYVLNDMLGGHTYYKENPLKIFYIWEGGLHIFGGFLFGVVALYFFLRSVNKDAWLFLDAIAPAALIGQALARPANFINQELYGPPTKLPWGIPIEANHRLAQFADLSKYPVETTRFHPTFAYEMILNILLALLLLWIARRYADKMKPGAIFAGWLISAGLARTFIEFFRPDQPRIGDSFVSFTMVVSFLMAVMGVIMLLIRYGKIQLAAAENWEDEYYIQPVERVVRPQVRTTAEVIASWNEDKAVETAADDIDIEEEKDDIEVVSPVSEPVEMEPVTAATAAAAPVAVTKTTVIKKTPVTTKAKPVASTKKVAVKKAPAPVAKKSTAKKAPVATTKAKPAASAKKAVVKKTTPAAKKTTVKKAPVKKTTTTRKSSK